MFTQHRHLPLLICLCVLVVAVAVHGHLAVPFPIIGCFCIKLAITIDETGDASKALNSAKRTFHKNAYRRSSP